jgi:hypothetical protein
MSAAILLKRSSADRELDLATSSTLSATVGRSPRPRFATLVRVRQEVSKRIDSARGAATSVDGRELRELLTPAAATALASADGLRPWFARRADTHFPRRHLLERDPDTLPDLERLLELADEAARSEWRVFGAHVKGDASNQWTTHPVSGAPTASAHWRSISYMNGVAGADVKFIWELNRHQALVRIAQGYFITRRPELAERVRPDAESTGQAVSRSHSVRSRGAGSGRSRRTRPRGRTIGCPVSSCRCGITRDTSIGSTRPITVRTPT